MRISSLQVFNTGVANMQRGQTSLAKLQEQISTGKNLNRPSDDPVAAAQILKFRREIAANETYKENITVSQRRLELEELTIQQVKDAGDRLKELAIRANNGTMNNQNRAGIATEVKEVQQFILGLMNTKDAQGEYLFAGAKGATQPFVDDGKGGFSYAGDNEVRSIQTGSSAFVQSTDSGREIFQTVPGDMAVKLLNSSTTNAAVTTPGAPAGFAVGVMPETTPGETPEFETWVAANGKQDLTLTVTQGAPNTYTLTGIDSTGAPVAVSGGPIPAVVPPATQSVLSPPGLSVDVGALAAGDVVTTTIRPEQPRHSLLTTAQKLIDALETPITDQASREQSAADVAEVMDEIVTGLNGLLKTQTQLGGRMVTLESQNAVNEDFFMFTKAALSNLEDLDYASAIAKFSFQEVALQAAQQTFSRVNQLSLFNYL